MNATIDFFKGAISNAETPITGLLALLVFILVLVATGLFFFRQYLIKRSKRKEFWLPIVDDGGNVIGRVARSVSVETPGKYQHPMIRIMVYKPGSIYLLPVDQEYSPYHGKYDHPFERMLQYGLSIEDEIKGLQSEFFPKSGFPTFLLKYKHENGVGKWQVLLYALHVKDEDELIGLNKTQGKFWTVQQIQENLGKSFFSNMLEGEFDFLKTITSAE